MNVNLISDLSVFSGIPESKFDNLADKSVSDICQIVREYLNSCEENCIINIGIGNLVIEKVDDDLLFKFIPSSYLKASIENTIETGKSPLVKTLESKVTERMLKIYKELF